LKIALFGGTFDPIHNAHLTVAREARAVFGLDRVLFIPAAHPPHKRTQTTAPYEDRYRMVELACEAETGFEASRLEERRETSYTVETLELLRRELNPDDHLYFLIGADAFAEIRTWRRWEDVLGMVTFIVVTRPGHDYEVAPGAKVERLETVALPVSSSEVREKLARGEPVPELPEPVLRYIRERALYGAARDQRKKTVR
jgi:nicotinate-nucleotide adenylyltransferase